ncbi:DUF6193 family natural product biosynthesis protein [Streptomyces sp. NBC_00454]|uniref:DUF6193 family natural product biosynthesis protein n=1 Tax=Streptomyces sp. NBC_00454 TaxID=2975747 RepID=UPI0030E426E3
MSEPDAPLPPRRPLPPKPELPDMAEARRRGPAAEVEARWLSLRLAWEWYRSVHGAGVGRRGTIALMEAAMADPVLRQFYPHTSHYNLHFSSTTERIYPKVAPYVMPLGDGRFRVLGANPPVDEEVDTAEEAVALVVARLAPGTPLAATGRPWDAPPTG